MANDDKGLRIIDISNPHSPAIRGVVKTASHAYDIDLDGTFAYVADGTGGLRVIDISDPANPVEKG